MFKSTKSKSNVLRLNDSPQEPQGVRRRFDLKLAIPTSLCIPEPTSLGAQCPCESAFPPSSPIMPQDPDARNVVVFGESGVGKSSVINMIAGKDITRSSNDAVGCTFQYQCHHVLLDGLSVNLWDTIGLDEGTEGTVPARQAENSLKAFLRHISRWNGIDLLLYCVRGTRVRQALLRNYNIFYAAICRKKVPVALVVTGLENYEEEMEEWWTEHEKALTRHGMRFDAHACVTTIHSNHPAIQNRLKESRTALRKLVLAKFDGVAWKADEDSLISASLPDVRALLGTTTEKRVTPFVMICNATHQVNHMRLFPPTKESRTAYISGRNYHYQYVDARQVLRGDASIPMGITQRPDLLIFYADAYSESDQMWTAFRQFHGSCGGETCPVIIVFGGLDDHEAAAKMWGFLSSSHNGSIIANPTYYPHLDGPRDMAERADEALAALIEEKCLIKFEEKLSKFQKLCRHSKLFFPGLI